jgi:molybdopterin molybdotransferase
MSALLPVEVAQARMLALAAPLAATRKSLVEALHHFLAEPLVARRTQPATALSAMDGYAIRYADLPGPWRQTGHIAAGQWPTATVGAGETMRIFTGAPLPEGADTVLIQEDSADNDGLISLTGNASASMGQHIRRAGSDFMTGATLAAAGSAVTPGVIALAAMAGYAELLTGAAPRVAIITTGDELVEPGAPIGPGQIPESNGLMLTALLAGLPANVTPVRRIADDHDATVQAIHDASLTHDVIVTVGGASVGDHDHVHAALTSLKAAPDFWKVAMRPGKPLMAAQLGDAVVLGLPGNPSSAFVTAQLFLLPLIRHLAGAHDPLPRVEHAPLAAPLDGGGARRDYLRAVLNGGQLTPLSSQDSGLVSALAAANALLIREAGAAPQSAGTMAPYIAI